MVTSAEFHCWYSHDPESAREKGSYLLQKFGSFLKGPVVDLGCGEGAFLLALMDAGREDIFGVESNDELATLAESFGVPVVRKDILEYLREVNLKLATYLYIDVVEHVPFDFNMELLNLLPTGSRLILQTPNTESLLGHQFYFNVPSHVAPYSPYTLKKMRRAADTRSYRKEAWMALIPIHGSPGSVGLSLIKYSESRTKCLPAVAIISLLLTEPISVYSR